MWDPVWDEIFRSQAWGKYPGEDLIRFIARHFYGRPDRAAVRVLEIGCGPGANLWFLAREGFAFAGVDGSEAAIRLAGERLDAECDGWRTRGEVAVHDIAKLPFADASFDAVIDSQAVYANPKAVAQVIFAEAARVTKPGGKLFSRAFAEGCWGDGTGESLGDDAWICDQGPLKAKGMSRFMKEKDIPAIHQGWNVTSIEKISRTMEGRRHTVEEWIIWADKA